MTEKFVTQHVKITVHRDSTAKHGRASFLRDDVRYGPFTRPDDDFVSPQSVKITVRDISTFITQQAINPPFLGSAMQYTQSNLWLITDPGPSDVDAFTHQLVHGNPSNDNNTDRPPRGLFDVGHYSSPSTSIVYRQSFRVWALPRVNSAIYDLTLKVNQSQQRLLTTNSHWKTGPSALTRLNVELARDDPDPVKVQALEWEVSETGPYATGENAWIPELDGFDPRPWWSTDTDGVLVPQVSNKRLVLGVSPGSNYFEESDPFDFTNFKVTAGPTFDSPEVSPGVLVKRTSNLLLVPKLWKVTVSFRLCGNDLVGPAGTVCTDFTYEIYMIGRTSPQLAPVDSTGFATNYKPPISVPSASVDDVHEVVLLLEQLTFTAGFGGVYSEAVRTALIALAADNGITQMGGIIAKHGRIAVETVGLTPARSLVSGVVTVPTTSFSAEDGDVWVWRRTLGVYTPVTVFSDQLYDSLGDFGVHVNNFSNESGTVFEAVTVFVTSAD